MFNGKWGNIGETMGKLIAENTQKYPKIPNYPFFTKSVKYLVFFGIPTNFRR